MRFLPPLILALGITACASGAPVPVKVVSEPATPAAPRSSASRPGYPAAGEVPPLAPDRKIAEQDCTRGIDLTAGNLRCR